ETDEPGANDAATISRFSASGHERLRGRPVAVMPITDFVDTSPPSQRQRSHQTRRNGAIQEGGPRRRDTDYLRSNFLSHCVWDTYEAILDACCDAWNALMEKSNVITSIGTRKWAQ